MKDGSGKTDRENFNEWKESTAEQRRWNRYPPAEGVLARMEGRTYRLLDIGGGGIALYDYGSEKVPEETIISLHSTDAGFYIDALRCRKVTESRVISYTPHGPEVINRIGLEIIEENPDTEGRLTPFMRK
jgi:hypothetical protein